MQELERRGAWCLKVPGGPLVKSGTPDILLCYRGLFIALEVKRPGMLHQVTMIQRQRIQEIRRAGGIAEVVTSVEQALGILTAASFNAGASTPVSLESGER